MSYEGFFRNVPPRPQSCALDSLLKIFSIFLKNYPPHPQGFFTTDNHSMLHHNVCKARSRKLEVFFK